MALPKLPVLAPLALACSCALAQTPRTTLPPVLIEGSAPVPELRRADSNLLTDAPLAETPLSATVLDTARLRERGAYSLSDAIREVPAVSDAYNTVGYVESLQVRGFRLDSLLNYRRDGLPMSNHMPLALENKASIDVIQGVTGLYGGGVAPGGLIDFRLKRPTDTPLRALYAYVAERGTVGLHGDLGGRSSDGAFGYRVNLAAVERRPQPRDAEGERQFASGYFDWRLSRDTTLAAEFEWHRYSQISVPGFGLLDVDGDGIAETLPAPIDPRTNLNNQPWSAPFVSRSMAGSLRLSQRLSDDWRLSLTAALQRIKTNDRIAFPDGCSNQAIYIYPGFCGNGDADLYDFRSEDERRHLRTFDALLAGRAQTGPLSHELRAGARTTRYSERFPPLQAYNYVGFTNMFAPIVTPPDPTPSVVNTLSDLQLDEIFAGDVIRYGKWSLWFGGRQSWLERSSVGTDGSEARSFDQRFFSPWVGLGFQPWSGGFGYLSWGRGVEIEAVPNRSQFANAGAVLPALRSEQVEIGFKQSFAAGHAFTVALFSIDKPYSDDIVLRQADPTNPVDPLFLRVGGAREARHRGVEFSGRYHISPVLRLDARAAWLDAETTRALDPLLVGKQTTNVAPFAGWVNLDWKLPIDGLSWSNAVAYSDRKPVTADNSVELPSYTQWDTALAWRINWGRTPLTWVFGIDNVTDRRYWREAPTQSWGGVYLFPAQPRTFRLSLAASF